MAKEKLTKKLIEQAVELKSSGLNDCDIAAAIGVSKHTFSRWMCHPETKLQRTLNTQIKKAESDYKETLLNTIKAAALARNSNWTAAAWLLERKYPEEYGQNRQLANADEDKAPQIVLGVQVQPAGAAALAGASLDGKALVAGAKVDGEVQVDEVSSSLPKDEPKSNVVASGDVSDKC